MPEARSFASSIAISLRHITVFTFRGLTCLRVAIGSRAGETRGCSVLKIRGLWRGCWHRSA